MTTSVLLVTLEGTQNFGNRLQHYALQQVIKSCGCNVGSLMVKPVLKLSNSKVKHAVKTILAISGIRRYKILAGKSGRIVKFLVFNTQYLTNVVRMPVDEVRRANWDDYAFAVTGSDQVWHNWHTKAIPDELSFYYLEFVEEAKRVSYAPSFGFTEFPEEDIEAHRRGLTGMRALSCREEEGCALIRELTGREAQKVLDPTLLLTAEDWASIENKPRFRTPKRYLLQFFLGEVTPEYRAEITRIAEQRGLCIINVNDPTDLKHYRISPDEFVWLVHHADTVCTDSFHASVFSVTFERNLRVFRRKEKNFEDMFGRLYDLLEPLGLMNVVYGEGDALTAALSDEARSYLDQERKTSLMYLKKSLNAE